MIGFKVDIHNAKLNFFDRKPVMDATDRATRQVLSRFGAFVRTRSRTSIRKSSKVSAEGSPPFSHGDNLLRDFILFAFEAARRSVIIGPAKLSGRIGNAPEALEEGGESEAFEGFGVKRKLVKTKVRARPYMLPAFEAELPGVDRLWANSVKG